MGFENSPANRVFWADMGGGILEEDLFDGVAPGDGVGSALVVGDGLFW